jgi:hypothetical protein
VADNVNAKPLKRKNFEQVSESENSRERVGRRRINSGALGAKRLRASGDADWQASFVQHRRHRKVAGLLGKYCRLKAEERARSGTLFNLYRPFAPG